MRCPKCHYNTPGAHYLGCELLPQHQEAPIRFRHRLTIWTLALVALFIWLALLAVPAQAHDLEGIETWEEAWQQQVDAVIDQIIEDDGLSTATVLALIELRYEREEWEGRHCLQYGLCKPKPKAQTRSNETSTKTADRTTWSNPDTERWRTLVEGYFGAKADTMLCIMYHESRGDPTALNSSSGAAGLFQIIPYWWQKWGGDPYDPATNVQTARQVYDLQGLTAWAPYKRGLCRGL